MAERRHVKTLPIEAARQVFETWLNNLPGRLFQCGPHPADPHTWLAITIEETER